jgi:hypothetical protein
VVEEEQLEEVEQEEVEQEKQEVEQEEPRFLRLRHAAVSGYTKTDKCPSVKKKRLSVSETRIRSRVGCKKTRRQ